MVGQGKAVWQLFMGWKEIFDYIYSAKKMNFFSTFWFIKYHFCFKGWTYKKKLFLFEWNLLWLYFFPLIKPGFFSVIADVLSNFVFFFPFVSCVYFEWRKCFYERNPNEYHFFDLGSWKMDDSCSFASVDTFSECSKFFFVDILIFFYRRFLILIIYLDCYSFI